MKKTCCIFFSMIFPVLLSSCMEKSVGEIHLASTQAALPTMEHITLSASRCWFKSGNKTFNAYRLAPELQSFSGRPRILIVPYEDPGSRPLLVIEATGNPAQIAVYGPLVQTKIGKQISIDLKRWIKGDKNC